jgi:tRNA(fMet)-specific endonuclease VapC
MARFLLDTDHFTHFEYRHPRVWQRFQAYSPGDVALSIVTVEEYLRGRLATVARRNSAGGPRLVAAYGQLEAGCNRLRDFPVAGFDANSETLFRQLRPAVAKPGTQDLRIAAIALVNNLILVTANTTDFTGIPGLVLEDWTV